MRTWLLRGLALACMLVPRPPSSSDDLRRTIEPPVVSFERQLCERRYVFEQSCRPEGMRGPRDAEIAICERIVASRPTERGNLEQCDQPPTCAFYLCCTKRSCESEHVFGKNACNERGHVKLAPPAAP